MDQERYYVINGELKANRSHAIPNVLIKNEDDLDVIKNLVEPGTYAHLATGNVMWELSASRNWVLVGGIEQVDGTDDNDTNGDDTTP